MKIRKPNEVEIEKILSLSPQAIFEGTLGEVEPTIEKAKQLVEPLLKRGSNYLIATENNVITGWVLIGGSKDQFSDKALGFIYELFVLEEYRGKGISKQLIKTGVEQLKQEGYSEIRLSVFDGNPAIKIYESLGFKNRTITMNISL
ncbi:acetyltransferase [Oceanobacillus picturae]|uniref:Acetyltransferase n=1 Tax=Oceanobacillus picturae TaxID=171693 RepID=W9AMF1_9BACI|nr:GNAT family N-acetyltransferase [Oceanobacillus picturae]RIU92042.1 GNAT family N-acetyltransferase [Oceanobacillus picturae]GAQ19589.1 acetyltransferase [Oceanobacillus picturae]CDO03841.1 putative N-acetyltransferase YycN [Oceanobacillus picturae]